MRVQPGDGDARRGGDVAGAAAGAAEPGRPPTARERDGSIIVIVATDAPILPAWSEPFSGDRRERLAHLPPFGRLDRAWAWGDADGGGVTVAIIDSMTPRERADAAVINGSRRKRIAKGSGSTVEDVNRLLKQFAQARKLMKSLGSGSAAMKRLGARMPQFR